MVMLKPKDMARLLGVTVGTLQAWDRKGLLKAYRTPTNRRYYTEKQYLDYIGTDDLEIGTATTSTTALKPSEMAERLGITTRTLQNWDKQGLLKAHRTPTGRKYYTEEQYMNCIGGSDKNH